MDIQLKNLTHKTENGLTFPVQKFLAEQALTSEYTGKFWKPNVRFYTERM